MVARGAGPLGRPRRDADLGVARAVSEVDGEKLTKTGMAVKTGNITSMKRRSAIPITVRGRQEGRIAKGYQGADMKRSGSLVSRVILSAFAAMTASTPAHSAPVVSTARVAILADSTKFGQPDVLPTGSVVAKSWLGGDGNWSDGANWSPAGAPTGADNIAIDFNTAVNSIVQLDIDFVLTTGTLVISAGDKLIINAGTSLTTSAGLTDHHYLRNARQRR